MTPERAPIPKHLPQTLLLVRSKDSCGLQVNVDIRVDRIIPKVVFCQQRVLRWMQRFWSSSIISWKVSMKVS